MCACMHGEQGDETSCQQHLREEMLRQEAMHSQQKSDYEFRIADLEKKLLLMEPERQRLKELDDHMHTVEEVQKGLKNDIARYRKRAAAYLTEINKVSFTLFSSNDGQEFGFTLVI